MSETYTLEQASNDLTPFDQGEQVETYDPGTLESEIGGDNKQNISMAEAVEQFDDESAAVPATKDERAVVSIGGQALTLADLVNGYLATASSRDAVRGLDASYQQVVEAAGNVVRGAAALAGYIASQLPPAPSADLSVTNPAAYIRAKAVGDEAHKIIGQVLHIANQTGQQAIVAATNHSAVRLGLETHRLVEHFPECADEAKRAEFIGMVRDAVYAAGFTENELRDVVDHRLYRLAHLAAIGLGKVTIARPLRAAKKRPATKEPSDAMGRLTESGALEDALSVDFD